MDRVGLSAQLMWWLAVCLAGFKNGRAASIVEVPGCGGAGSKIDGLSGAGGGDGAGCAVSQIMSLLSLSLHQVPSGFFLSAQCSLWKVNNHTKYGSGSKYSTWTSMTCPVRSQGASL